MTSDANGNLAVTNEPVPVSDQPSGDEPVAAGSGSGKTAPQVETIDASNSGPLGENFDGAAQPVDETLVGANLTFGGTPASTPIPSNGFASGALGDNLSTAQVNAQAIEVNRQEIARNAIKIDQAFARIASNSDAIEANSLLINDLQQGLAAVAALPDMYLNPNEKWAAGGSVAVFGEEIGVGATLTVRGNDNWSFGASAGMGGDEATGKIQLRYAGTNF